MAVLMPNTTVLIMAPPSVHRYHCNHKDGWHLSRQKDQSSLFHEIGMQSLKAWGSSGKYHTHTTIDELPVWMPVEDGGVRVEALREWTSP